MYVPVLTLVMDFSPHTATAMSQALMCGGVLAGTILNLARRHPETDGPLIDLDLVILLAPAQMAGVSLGQVVNRCLPPWLLVCFLVAVLSVAVYQTLKQYKRCRAARLARKKAKHQEASSGEESCSFRTLSLPAPATARAEAAPPPQRGKAKTETETEMETDCPENQQGDFEEDGRKRRALQVREKEDGESEAKAAVCEGQDASAEETGTLGNKSTLAEAVEADSFDSDVSLSRAEKEKRSRLQRTKRRLKKADERHGLGVRRAALLLSHEQTAERLSFLIFPFLAGVPSLSEVVSVNCNLDCRRRDGFDSGRRRIPCEVGEKLSLNSLLHSSGSGLGDRRRLGCGQVVFAGNRRSSTAEWVTGVCTWDRRSCLSAPPSGRACF